MHRQSVVQVTRARRVRLLVYTAGGAIAALLLTTAPASANDMGGAVGLFFSLAAFFVYSVLTWPIEGAILSRFLKVGFWRCLGCAIVANVVSTGLGLVWMEIWGRGGWKVALWNHDYDAFALLLVRSFLITLVEEGIILSLLLRKRRDTRMILKAATWANAITYGLSVPVFLELVHLNR